MICRVRCSEAAFVFAVRVDRAVAFPPGFELGDALDDSLLDLNGQWLASRCGGGRRIQRLESKLCFIAVVAGLIRRFAAFEPGSLQFIAFIVISLLVHPFISTMLFVRLTR